LAPSIRADSSISTGTPVLMKLVKSKVPNDILF
jgi:hypothetical protein